MHIEWVLLLLASVAGGAANALAGGGTFLVFPALLLAGVAPVMANATASLILWPSGLASAWVFRKGLRENRGRLVSMSLASALGAAAGSVLLLSTSNTTFDKLVPWLLLGATAIFTFSGQLRQIATRGGRHSSTTALLAGQLVIAVYGGYFGAGMGVLMLALYLAASPMDVHAANGLRTLCGAAINLVAIVIFAARGALDWRVGVPMLIVAIAGGYWGAHAVRRLQAEYARRAILIYAWTVTAWFFARMLMHALKPAS